MTLDMYVEKWRKIGLSTEPADRPTAEWGMRWLYKTQQKQQPRIEWKTSPQKIAEGLKKNAISFVNVSSELANWGVSTRETREAFQAMARTMEQNIAIPIRMEARRGTSHADRMMSAVNPMLFVMSGQFLAGILGWYDYLIDIVEKNKELGFEVYGLTNLAISAGFAFPLEDVCYISERPISIQLDENDRLHGEDAPAVAYADGFEVWAWHGNLVGEKVIKQQFTWKEIQEQNNIEIRRSMIDIYGTGKYLIDAGAKELHSDGFGTLYRLENEPQNWQTEEPLVMVKVVNSTPEPDGSYKDYFLRVPPQMETAEQAVAWTFEMGEGETEETYQPKEES